MIEVAGAERSNRSALIFTGLSLLFFWRFVAGEFLCWGDAYIQFWPWRHFTRELMLNGQLPLWNPYNFCGVPFAANPQTGVFYPLNWLALPIPAHAWVSWSAALHVWLAGIGMTRFLSTHHCSAAAQVLGACAFAFSGCLIARLQFTNHMVSFAGLPWLLWRYEATRANPVRRAMDFAVITALLWLGGHPQVTIIALTTVAAFVIYDRPDTRSALAILIGLLGGLMLSAIQLLPATELLLNSSRGELTDFQRRLFALPPWQLIVWLVPDAFGNPARSMYWGEGNFFEASPFVGIVTLLLAGLGVSARPKLWPLLVGLVIIGMLLAMGYYGPLYPLVAKLPMFGMFRAAGRWNLLAVFALATLAAFGLDRLDESRARKMFAAAAVCALVMTWLALAMVFFNNPIAGHLKPALRWIFEATGKVADEGALVAQAGTAFLIPWAVLLLCLVVTRAMSRGLISVARARTALFAVVFLDLFLFGAELNPTAGAGTFRVDRVASNSSRTRFATTSAYVTAEWNEFINYATFQTSGARANWRGPLAAHLPVTNLVTREYHATGYDPVRLRSAERRLRRADETGDWSGLGVTTILDQRGQRKLAPTRKSYENWYPGWRAYANSRPIPMVDDDGWRRVESPNQAPIRFVFQNGALLVGGALSLLAGAVLAAVCATRWLQPRLGLP